MMSMGRNTHWPSACTAGTLFADIARTNPTPMKANATKVNAEEIERMAGQRHAERHGQDDLQQSRNHRRRRSRAPTVLPTRDAAVTGASR